MRTVHARYGISLALVLMAGLLGGSAATVLAVTPTTTTYDAIPSVIPGNVVSLGYEATSTGEFGDLIRLAPGPRLAAEVDVLMSSWGCEDGGAATCVTTPGATFSHPLTLTIYAVDHSGPIPAPGAVVATKTTTFAIPYRPSADPTCPGGTAWRFDATTCFNGLAHLVTFDLSTTGATLPSELIWAVAYDTTHHGASPIGEGATCYAESGGCGYDSLNVGAQSFPGEPSVGTDIDPDGAVLDSTWPGAYCDGGSGGTGTLRIDTTPACWTDFRPLATIRTSASSTDVTTVVTEADMQGWAFFEEVPEATGALVDGPASPPLGSGSARMTLDASGREILLNGAYAGTRFDDITSLAYATYRASADPGNNLAIAIQFDVDYDLTDTNTAWQGRLVFEPYQTPGAGGTVVEDTWQTWDALDGAWWASGAPGSGPCGQATPCSWAEILTLYPDAGVRVGTTFPGFVNLKAGGPAPGFDGNVDAFSIGVNEGGSITTTTFDFEHVDLLGACAVDISGTAPVTYTLLGDCITDATIIVPQHAGGSVFDGDGYTITAMDPSSGHFLGAVLQAEAGAASIIVTDTTITTSGLADVCDADTARLRGILFDGVAGSITGNTVTGLKQATASGCQEGNGIEARHAPFAKGGVDKAVVITGNTVTDYQKSGIVASGSVNVSVTGNVVTGAGPITYIGQNGIQLGFGATGIVKNNTVSGNDYTPSSFVACGVLFFEADGVKASANDLFANEKNQCNFGKGGGNVSPTQ